MSNVFDWWHVFSNWSLFIGRVNYPTISHSTNATWGPLSFVSKSLPLKICNRPDFGTPPRFNHETYCNHIGSTPPKTIKHRTLNYEIVGRQKTSSGIFHWTKKWVSFVGGTNWFWTSRGTFSWVKICRPHYLAERHRLCDQQQARLEWQQTRWVQKHHTRGCGENIIWTNEWTLWNEMNSHFLVSMV